MLRSSVRAALVAALLILPAAPAAASSSARPADHEWGGGGYEEGCGRGGGGCGNEREEDYGDGSCKYFCPAFDRSPVDDSFNPQICVMPGSCAGERRPGDEPPPEEPAPSSSSKRATMEEPEREPGVRLLQRGPRRGESGGLFYAPASLFPPTPEKVLAAMQALFEAGVNMGRTFVDVTLEFVLTVGRVMV